MVTISDLNEASILWNLRIRYDNQNIYTHIGKPQKHCVTTIKKYFKAQNKLQQLTTIESSIFVQVQQRLNYNYNAINKIHSTMFDAFYIVQNVI